MELGTVVIGAGPAGLAVAAALRRRGLRCDVLERGHSVGFAWQQRYDSLHLHTSGGFLPCPERAFPGAAGDG